MPRRQNKHLYQQGFAQPLLLGVLLVLVVLFAALATNRQGLYDWLRLRNYQAPADISKLADQTTMTPMARRVYYVNHPLLQSKQDFSGSCPGGSREQTIVLGCYHSDQNGIFLLGVSDPRLDGVEQVTAAHEMLHAAYDRLSSQERQNIDKQLEDYYNNGLNDDRIRQTIDAYRKTEPNDLVNEMHSIFGTEVMNLPPGLEKYYAQYFTNRKQVANYAAQYQSVFTSRQAAVRQDDAQLAVMKSQISDLEANLKSMLSQVQSQRTALEQKRNSGDISGYNAGVAGYNNLVDNYNSGVRELQGLIGQYNQLVASRNAIALQEDQLVNELQTNTAPISQ